MTHPRDDVVAVALLAEPQRARIYEHLASGVEPMTRQEVAETLGIGRTLVAFHLDKLEHAGLIAPVSQTATTRGPGRPARRYQVVRTEISASVPPRRYELLADVLVRAGTEQAMGEPLSEAAVRVAKRRGGDVATQLRAVEGPTGARERLSSLLQQLGYAPRTVGSSVVLTNCPFRRMRDLDPELVCSINLGLAAGYLDALRGDVGLTPRLRPCDTNCCVVLEPSTGS